MRARILSLTIGILGLAGCHRPVVHPPESVAPCFAPYPPPPVGRIRLDGPGSFGPHANDSLIVRVGDRELWRDVLRSCVRATPGLSIDFGFWQASGDTLETAILDRVRREQPPTVWVLQLVARRKPN